MNGSRNGNAAWWAALKVACIFLVASTIWIVGSDFVAERLAPTEEVLAGFQTYKGLVYTAIMSLLICVAVRHSFTREQRVWAALREGEAKYRRLVESLDREYLIFSHGADGVFTYVSPSVENVLGYSQDEYAKHYAETFTESVANTDAVRHTEASLRGERQPPYEIEVRHKDGSTRQMNVIEIPVFDEDGKVLAVEGIARDITEQKKADEVLRASEERYRSLFEAANDAVFLVEGDRFIECNSRTLEMFDCTFEQILQETPFRFSPPQQPDGSDSGEKALELIAKAYAGRPQFFEWRHCRYDGSPFDAEVGLNRFEIAGEYQLFAIVRDITERKRAADAVAASERLYRTLFESAGDGIGLVKIVGDGIRYVDCNARQAEMYGCRREEVLGCSPVDFSPTMQADGRSSAEKATEVATAALAGVSQLLQWKRRAKDGALFDTEVTLTLADIAGEQLLMTIVRDITDRKRAEKELRDSERKLNAIFNHHHQLTGLLDADGRLLAANKTALEFAGVDESEVIGRYLWESPWWDPSQQLEIRRAIERAAKGEFVRIESPHTRADGEIRDFDFSLSPVHDDDGNVVYLVPEGRDITKIKRAAQELRKAHDELEQRVDERTAELANSNRRLEEANVRLKQIDQLKSMFIASMSHELRTPLNSIIGFTGIVLQGMSGELTDKQRDHLSRSYGSAKHLLELITDVIDISKIEAGRIDLFPAECVLADVVDEAIESVRPQAENKGLGLAATVPEDCVLYTDRLRLLQCLLNFLSNAVKYSEAGEITLCASVEGEEIEIAVSDTGIGIAEEDMPKVFEAFERLDSHLRVPAGGAGLGLHLTRKIATDLLRGSVAVHSELGKGSTFTLRIPKHLKRDDDLVGAQGEVP